MSKFNQIVVWEATVVGEEEIANFEKFIKDEFDVTVKYVTEVLTNPDQDSNGNPVPDTGGRNDVLFYVHDDDVMKFAIPKLQLGCRWWEDVVGYNDGAYLYPEEILEKYKLTW